jgi:acyl carrier protein
MKQDLIVILDLGSTSNTVLARAIRELGVYSEIHPHDITVDELKALKNVKGILLNGGENRIVNGQAVEIRPDSSFKEDLGVDSLDLFELVMALEDEFGVEIPPEDLETMNTVGDVAEYLKNKGVEE